VIISQKVLGFRKKIEIQTYGRVGFVASEVVRHGGIVICSLIAPYRDARRSVRGMIEHYGEFIEVYVQTSIDECARRDTKGLYEKARQGLIKNFTGIDDPYEEPENPELIAKTEEATPEELVSEIIEYLRVRGVMGKM
jgi:sulfate adenylyltransferase